MAKISDTSGSSNIWLGTKYNTKQTILYLPASNTAGEGAADKPGLLFLEAVDDTGAMDTGLYLWADSAGALRYSATYPTNEDGSGSIIGGAGATALLASGTVTNTALVRGDGGARGMEKTGILISDTTEDLVLPDGADLKLQEEITFTGATTENKIVLTDKLAVALDITESTNSYLQFVTTDGSEEVTFGKKFTAPTACEIGNLTLGDGSIVDSGGTVDFTTTNLRTGGDVWLDADDAELQLGAVATDSYIKFDGTHLIFYDTNLAAEKTLEDLLTGTQFNPSVNGDLSVTDGNFDWNNNDNEAATWAFSNTAASDIDIASSATTGECIHIVADSITTGQVLDIETDSIGAAGALISLDITAGAGHDATGNFIQCHDGSGDVFEVGKYGAVIIAGTAGGTAALTMTKGDLVISDGIINLDLDSNHGALNVTRNYVGAASTPTVYIKEDYTGANQSTLQVVSDVTGAYDTVDIDHAGTGSAVNITNTATTGTQLELVGPASQTTSMVVVDADTGPWIGVANTGALHIKGDGVLASTAASLLYSTYTGNAGGTSVTGTCGNFYDAGAASGTSAAVWIGSDANNALTTVTGGTTKTTITATGPAAQTANLAYFNGTTGSGWIGGTGTGVVNIAGDGDLAHANASMLQIAYSGQALDSALGSCIRSLDSGTASATQPAYANYFSSTNNDVAAFVTGSVSVANITATSYTNQVESMVILDGTTADWLGADGNGMIEIHSDATFTHANASMVHMVKTGQTVASMEGSCLNISDASTGGATSGYAAYINASGGLEALHVDAGQVIVDEFVVASPGTATGGLATRYYSADLTDTPIDSEFDTAFGATALALAGFIGVAYDTSQTKTYLVVSDGTNWYYTAAMTKAL